MLKPHRNSARVAKRPKWLAEASHDDVCDAATVECCDRAPRRHTRDLARTSGGCRKCHGEARCSCFSGNGSLSGKDWYLDSLSATQLKELGDARPFFKNGIASTIYTHRTDDCGKRIMVCGACSTLVPLCGNPAGQVANCMNFQVNHHQNVFGSSKRCGHKFLTASQKSRKKGSRASPPKYAGMVEIIAAQIFAALSVLSGEDTSRRAFSTVEVAQLLYEMYPTTMHFEQSMDLWKMFHAYLGMHAKTRDMLNKVDFMRVRTDVLIEEQPLEDIQSQVAVEKRFSGIISPSIHTTPSSVVKCALCGKLRQCTVRTHRYLKEERPDAVVCFRAGYTCQMEAMDAPNSLEELYYSQRPDLRQPCSGSKRKRQVVEAAMIEESQDDSDTSSSFLRTVRHRARVAACTESAQDGGAYEPSLGPICPEDEAYGCPRDDVTSPSSSQQEWGIRPSDVDGATPSSDTVFEPEPSQATLVSDEPPLPESCHFTGSDDLEALLDDTRGFGFAFNGGAL